MIGQPTQDNQAELSCSPSHSANNKRQVATCNHCGLPVWTDNKHQGPVYCCYGCQMVEELQEKNTNGDLDEFSLPTDLLARWVISFVFSMLLLFLSLTIHLEESEPTFFYLLSLALSTAIWVILGREVIRTLLLEFKNRTWSLATLIFTGSLASYVLSVYNLGLNLLANQGADTYFETSGMILSFYVGSILIDVYFKQKVSSYSQTWEDHHQEILKKTPGGWYLSPLDSIEPGDQLKIHGGQNFPVDGTMLSPVGYVQESHLTGEEEPILKNKNDYIKAGSIALESEFIIKAHNTPNTSSLQDYFETYRSLKAKPSRFEQMAHKAARYLLITMFGLALMVFVGYAVTGPLQTALNHTLAVLLIGCPCAFSIATPAALWIAQNKLHNAGVLLRTGSFALEQLSSVKHLFFDKTGTLTREAEPTSVRWMDSCWAAYEELVWGIMAGLEGEQYHPLAKAIRKKARLGNIDPAKIQNITLLQGLGVEGEWKDHNDKPYIVKVINHLHPEGKKLLVPGEFALTIDQIPVLKFELHLPLKDEVKHVLNELSKTIKGEIHLLSGDPVPREELQGKNWSYNGGLTPEQKAKFIKETVYKEGGKDGTAFIGDGLNDLMAMAETDVNIVMFEGAGFSKSEADIVMYNPHIRMVNEIYGFAKRVRRILLSNFFWALSFNLIGLTLAAAGVLNPLISIAAMILSSILVTLNSLRLRTVTFNSTGKEKRPF